MRKILIVLLFITQLSCAQESYEADYLFTNVSVLTMKDDNVLLNKNILVKEGKIKEISNTNSNLIKTKYRIDLEGKYIMPSLSDAHVHLPKNEDELEKFLTLNLINGITKLRSMRGDWNHLEWRNKYNTEISIYPKLYLSAPPISKKYDFNSEKLKRYIDRAKEFHFIKILSIKNETLFKELNSFCKLNSIQIGGHFPNNISDDQLFKSNYTSFEHLGGLTEELELLENRLHEIKKNNIFICPTLSWYSVGSGRYSYEELLNQDGMQFVSKAIVNDWIEKTKQYREKLGTKAYKEEVENELKKLDEKYQIIQRLNKLGINMLLSPDSSSKYMVTGFGIVGEMELLKNADLSNFDIFKMTTVNFASFFNENYGTIEEGKDADFIILNSNPLENLDTLKAIEGVFFNKNYLNKDALIKLSEAILPY
ncbi:MAG: amidohydrolase family protein [Bacteroidetes bacterium]|nr:amidohydrolase family protein [Bacteroidota bacterium]